ncbi:MAG: hypothetical protein AB7U73_11530 [Pirellulales bacterium]
MTFQRYTIEPLEGKRGYRIVGHWGLTRVLVRAVTSLREALRRHPDAELVDYAGDPFAIRASRQKVSRPVKRLI